MSISLSPLCSYGLVAGFRRWCHLCEEEAVLAARGRSIQWKRVAAYLFGRAASRCPSRRLCLPSCHRKAPSPAPSPATASPPDFKRRIQGCQGPLDTDPTTSCSPPMQAWRRGPPWKFEPPLSPTLARGGRGPAGVAWPMFGQLVWTSPSFFSCENPCYQI
jgi:hypothetical protein